MEWKYTTDWSEEELTNGSYCGFVYFFEFGWLYLSVVNRCTKSERR
jgi:hypothetical protein